MIKTKKELGGAIKEVGDMLSKKMGFLPVGNLLTQNDKLKKTSKITGQKIMNFSISALFNRLTGRVTCPFAGICKKYCYAQKGHYVMYPKIMQYMDTKHEITRGPDFVELMSASIRLEKVDFLRIHDSGDFYSPNYISKWFEVMEKNPKTKFYAYTKSHSLFSELPENFRIIKSFGGTKDHLIDVNTDFHAHIFENLDEMSKCGYVNSSDNDAIAATTKNLKIGLTIH